MSEEKRERGEGSLQEPVGEGAEAALRPEGVPPSREHGERPPGVEPDLPPTRKLFLQIAVLGVLLVFVLIGLWQYFKLDTTAEVYRKELSVPSRELQELLARDEGRLSDYDLLDEKRGIYQIPIRRAMEMILADPALLGARRQPGPSAETQKQPPDRKQQPDQKQPRPQQQPGQKQEPEPKPSGQKGSSSGSGPAAAGEGR